VRPPAQIGEFALRYRGHRLALGNAGDDLRLVMLSDALEVGYRLVAREHFPRNRVIAFRDFLHPLLDCRKVFGRERALERES